MPEGKLTATWARRYEDYPFADTYSYLNGNLEKEEYREGIYVGYRYFESFGVKPLFSFGYGLSYTSFKMEFRGWNSVACRRRNLRFRRGSRSQIQEEAMPAEKWRRYMYLFLRAELKKRAEDLRDLQRQTV